MRTLTNSWYRMKQHWRLLRVTGRFLLNLDLKYLPSRRCLMNNLYVTTKLIIWPCCISVRLLSQYSVLGSNPRQSVWDWWLTNWHWNYMPTTSVFSCQISSYHSFIYFHLWSGGYYTRLISNTKNPILITPQLYQKFITYFNVSRSAHYLYYYYIINTCYYSYLKYEIFKLEGKDFLLQCFQCSQKFGMFQYYDYDDNRDMIGKLRIK
jgi:hypothetical protein